MSKTDESSSLIYINWVVSFVFITWFVGWLSSFYNTLMFFINRLLNGLLFGESLFVINGFGLRSAQSWWMGVAILVINLASIAITYGIYRGYLKDKFEEDSVEIYRVTHIALIILCSVSSLFSAFLIFIKHRIQGGGSLIRNGKLSLQKYKNL